MLIPTVKQTFRPAVNGSESQRFLDVDPKKTYDSTVRRRSVKLLDQLPHHRRECPRPHRSSTSTIRFSSKWAASCTSKCGDARSVLAEVVGKMRISMTVSLQRNQASAKMHRSVDHSRHSLPRPGFRQDWMSWVSSVQAISHDCFPRLEASRSEKAAFHGHCMQRLRQSTGI